jgi:predicted nucleotidyltransferase
MQSLPLDVSHERLNAVLSQLKQRLIELYGDRLEQLILYGSQARGDATIDSDIDVLVVLNGVVNSADEITRTGHLTAALSLDYSVVISCVFIAADRYLTEQSPLLLNVRREGVRF